MSAPEFTQADIDFASFLATTTARQTPAMLRHSAWTDPPERVEANAYDQETERQRALIHTNTKEHAS